MAWQPYGKRPRPASRALAAADTVLTASVPRLVATGSRTGSRRLTRKAILEVNVVGACETIERPPGDAPLALRLQANLLYGVTRVYQQQCGYMLTDVEKTRDHMRLFTTTWSTDNAIVENAGKAK